MKDISSITLSTMDRVDSLSKIKGVILQEAEFHEGNLSNHLGVHGNVNLRYDAAYGNLHLSKTANGSDEELIAVKDKYLTKMTNEINAESICVRTDLKDGFSKHEFFKSVAYNSPKKNWFGKFAEKLGKV